MSDLDFHVQVLRDEDGNVIGSKEETRTVDLSEHLANIEAQAVADHNATIRAQLREADIAMLRALYEDDTTRINQHRQAQAALRAQLKPA